MQRQRPAPLTPSWNKAVADRQPTPYPPPEPMRLRDVFDGARRSSNSEGRRLRQGEHYRYVTPAGRRSSLHRATLKGSKSSSPMQKMIDAHNAEISERKALPKKLPRFSDGKRHVRFLLPRLASHRDSAYDLVGRMERLEVRDEARNQAARCKLCGQRV